MWVCLALSACECTKAPDASSSDPKAERVARHVDPSAVTPSPVEPRAPETEEARDALLRGHRAAVSLTYDDGLDTHVHEVAAVLAAHRLRATFFVSSFPGVEHDWALPSLDRPLTDRHEAWRQVARAGHELASHTVFHPCSPELHAEQPVGFRLSEYDDARMAEELSMSRKRLARLQDDPVRSFAYPCESDRIGIGPKGSSYAELVDARFTYARGSKAGPANPADVDLQDIPVVDTKGLSGDALVTLVEDAQRRRQWLVLLFHGVGEEATCPNLDFDPAHCAINYLVTSADAHRSLATYLAEHEEDVWTAPMGEIAAHLDATREPTTADRR